MVLHRSNCLVGVPLASLLHMYLSWTLDLPMWRRIGAANAADGLNENLSSISICSSSRCPSDWDVFFGQELALTLYKYVKRKERSVQERLTNDQWIEDIKHNLIVQLVKEYLEESRNSSTFLQGLLNISSRIVLLYDIFGRGPYVD
uniref:Uncharacterized protein n=1 Tax=Oryza sativa subsp. japonica TaxID=39947 RepID=Q6K4X8_ORYSJ|nr:hypothetical protein [Oryza sativa Japonica Group]